MKNIIGLTILFLTFSGVIGAQNKNMNSKNNSVENQPLTTKQQNIVKIAALTAIGDLDELRTTLNEGLDAKLTVNEIKEILVQMYAYSGFPRSLNGINAFMKALEERKKKSLADAEGKTATPIGETSDKYERGRKTLEKLTGQPQTKPAKGFGEFSPQIDRFLKEHLFADIFDSDVLTCQQRELATISALAAMTGVSSQLESHISMGINVGLTENQLKQAFDLIERNIGKQQAEIARKSLEKIVAGSNRQSSNANKSVTDNKNDDAVFSKDERAPAENFTGTVYVQMLAPRSETNNFSIGSVTFEPNARSRWHTHPAGQTLIVTNGKGLYQEKGQPIKTINKGETIVCPAGIEHWHGASSTSQMSHIAITNYKDDVNVVWLKPVTDDEYTTGAK